jgi:hypothetical protein
MSLHFIILFRLPITVKGIVLDHSVSDWNEQARPLIGMEIVTKISLLLACLLACFVVSGCRQQDELVDILEISACL